MSRQRRSRHEEPETGEEGSLDHGRLRRHRPPLWLELDGGKAGDGSRGDRYSWGQRGPNPPGLLPTRLPTPRNGRVLAASFVLP